MKKFYLSLAASIVALVLVVSPLYAKEAGKQVPPPPTCCVTYGDDPGW